MKSIKEQVGGRPLSAVTPETKREAAYRGQLQGIALLRKDAGVGACQEGTMKRIIEVRFDRYL